MCLCEREGERERSRKELESALLEYVWMDWFHVVAKTSLNVSVNRFTDTDLTSSSPPPTPTPAVNKTGITKLFNNPF